MAFGENISTCVVTQLDQRSCIFERETRTPDDLRFLTQKNAWIRAISFVNEGGSSNTSKELVLAGGAASFNGETFTITSGIQLRESENIVNPSYRYTSEKGVKPVPGITGFNVKSKGTYGTLKDTTIEFYVSTLDDLERVEKLYFRPGFHILVEWGNTVYVDNNGTVQNYIDTGYNQFFQQSVSKNTILNHISNRRSVTSNNYDGFLGLIKNFSWSYKRDGGYDCTVSIASLGEVVESLTVKLPGYFETEYDDATTKAFRKSEFHLFAHILRKYNGDNPVKIFNKIDKYTDPGVYDAFNKFNIFRAIKEELTEDKRTDIAFAAYYEVKPVTNFYTAILRAFGGYLMTKNPFALFRETRVYFITLRTFLAMVNYYIKKYLRTYSTVFDLRDESTYKSFETHFSLNPLSTLLPKIPKGNASSLYVYGLVDLDGDGTVPQFADTVTNLQQLVTPRSFDNRNLRDIPAEFKPIGLDQCQNILISTRTLLNSVERYFTNQQDPRDVSFIDLVKDVLSTVNRDLGNVNSLDIEYVEDTDKYIIVDRENTPNTISSNVALDLTGLRSTILNASISSKITNKLGSQIAIAAQAGKSSYNGSVAKYRQWNENLTDRVSNSFDANEAEATSTEEQLTQTEIDSFLADVEEAYRKLNQEGQIIPDLWDSVQVKGENVFNSIIDKYSLSQGQLPKGIIPVEVTLTLDGISGIKVAQTFTIKKGILPEKYSFNNTSVKFGFIVNGLEHTIQGNKWVTTVSAQAFLIGRIETTSTVSQQAREDINRLFTNVSPQN